MPHSSLIAGNLDHYITAGDDEGDPAIVKIEWCEARGATGPGNCFSVSYSYLSRKYVWTESKGTFLPFVNQHDRLAGPAKPSTQPHFWAMRSARDGIDFNRVRGWISDCDKTHARCAANANRANHLARPWPFPNLKIMRFIDVNQRCIVEKPYTCQYIALSYVWGAVSGIRLSKSNKERLMQPKSLDDAWDLLPRTIQDAITVVASLEQTYLWVDSLCLIQNDPEDLGKGTYVMDDVYECSTLTIIAACGRDSNHGLPGVSLGSRPAPLRVSEVRPGLELTLYTAPEHLLAPTVYSSRGWTLQEQKLSTRTLSFIDNQVFFCCPSLTRAEGCIDEAPLTRPLKPRSGTVRDSNVASFEQMAEYMQTVQDYSARGLTHESDAYNALRGILRRFEFNMGCRFVAGLPSIYLEAFVSFGAEKSSLRRRRGFPSYSWSGWVGQIQFSTRMLDRTRLGSGGDKFEALQWICWYVTNDTTMNLDRCTLSDSPRDAFPMVPGISLPSSLPTCPSVPGDLETEGAASTIPRYPKLAFWTLLVFLGLGSVDFKSNGEITDENGRVCGHVLLDGHDDTDFFEHHGILGKPALQLILLSFDHNWSYPLFQYDKPTIHGDYNLDEEGAFLVMCIERLKGSDARGKSLHYAERRGVGLIAKRAVAHSFAPGPVWEQIILA
ncbi:heterokaryon incompatibility protein-domain-containing protein [Cladorrhinum sp. PSN332]|nr:heterokaryon incompatibility protein-domain-containing protein [Cladorrhinum sp. PSN332]